MWTDFPKLDQIDRARFARDLRRIPAQTRYVIFFTPRSGSSWLTDIVTATGRLGSPGELFNPNFLPRMLRNTNATSLEEYREIMVRRRNTSGVFGFQITYHQLAAVFGEEDAFLELFPSRSCFWLVRRDIIRQGVSLHKMQVTSIAHAPQTTAEDIRAGDESFSYDADAIELWTRHILAAEQSTEAMFSRTGLRPLRMWYERNVALGPKPVLNRMHEHLGVTRSGNPALAQSAHTKIGTDLNQAYAWRFRKERPDVVAEIEQRRSVTLKGLIPYKDQVAGSNV